MGPALIVAAVLAVFSPILGNGFVEFDDALALVNNPHFRGLGLEQLRWMFGHFWGVHYFPLTWLSFGLDYTLWGMNPGGYHLTSLLLHALNGILFYRLCLRLSLANTSAAFAALVFAIHPLRVESVAWAVQRSDVLSGAFYLGTVLAWLDDRKTTAAGLFLAGLLSKATGVCLPLALVVLDAYRGRPPWRGKLPLFALSAACGLLGLLAHQPGSTATLVQTGWGERLAQAVYGLAFYPLKTLLPVGLLPLYEAPRPLWPAVVLSAAAVAAAAAGLYAARKRWPSAPAAGACYALLLLPSLGLFKFGPQFAADRYSYLSCLPWAALAGGGLSLVSKRHRTASWLAAGLLLAVWGTRTYRQSTAWRDDLSLWSRAVTADPGNFHAHNYLGRVLERYGREAEARAHFQASVELNPAHAPARNNLGNALARQGRLEEAIVQYREALRLSPEHPVARRNLEQALAAQKRSGPFKGTLPVPGRVRSR